MAIVTVTKTVEFTGPEPTENPAPDWSSVLRMAREKFEADKSLKLDPKDIREYIYEGVMSAVYGEKFWPWSNERAEFKE